MPLPKIRKKAPVNPPSIRVIVKRLKKGGRSAARSSKQRISERNMNIYFEGDKRVFFPLVGGQEQQRPQEKKEETDDSGIDLSLSDLQKPLQSPLTSEEKDILRRISVKYPLIPRFPRPNEKVYAYAHIQWDPKRNAIVYNVIEPFISQKEKDVIEAVKKELEERLDVDFLKIGKIKAKDVLRQEIRDIFSKMGIGSRNTDVLQYYIERDIIGLGKIEPFMRDGEIEDVSCDGERVPLHVYHRNPLIGSIVTNVLFEGGEELDTFVMKLAQKCGKSISVAEPLVDGSLPEGSRVQATLATDIARKGSNFTIRKFASDPLTPVHMLEYGTMDSTQMAYMWLIIENRKSVLISGGTATGKTSMLNALSLFIKPSLKIVSIEDTPELKIPHPHWVPEVARTPIAIGKKTGEVSLFDLLKESLRQRPDYIIVGEVRGREAYVLFQQIATGHAGLATIHAASFPQLVDRLLTPPISLPPSLIENLDVILFLVHVKIKDRYVRKLNEVIEIKGVKDERPIISQVFKWNSISDKFELKGKSKTLEDIANLIGLTEDSLKEELRVRKAILEWMLEKKIFDYRDVSNIINGYYTDPEKIINLVEGT